MLHHVRNSKNFSVKLRGSVLTDVIWCDDCLNEALIYVHDMNGNRIPNAEKPEGFETIVVKGPIEVTETAPVKTDAVPVEVDWFGSPMVCLGSPVETVVCDDSEIRVLLKNMLTHFRVECTAYSGNLNSTILVTLS
jgi:hypothetical protein